MTDILYFVLFFADGILEAASLWVILRYVFVKEPVRSPAAYCAFAALFAANAFLLAPFLAKRLYDFDGWADTVAVLILLASSYLLFRDRRQIKTLITVMIYDATVEMFWSLFAQYLPEQKWIEELFCAAMHLTVCVFILLAAKKTAFNVLPEVFADIPKWVWGVLFLFELTCYYKEFGYAASWYSALYTASSAAVIFCILYLVFKVFRLVKRQNGIIEQLDAQKAYGESLIKNDEELRRFRHDYKNHMTVVSALLGAGKTNDASAYLTALNAPVEGAMKKISTGNFVADAIINTKASDAAASGGEIVFDGVIPAEGLRGEDLCTVLANLLDNAVEAIRKNGEGRGTVTVSAGCASGYFHIRVCNPTNAANGADPAQTTKKDRKNHGIGLKNVKRTAESRGGTLITSVEDGIFTAEVSMLTEA